MGVRLTERVSAPFSGCRVDRERGIIFGALICGKSSLNGNDYGPEVWPPVIHKYEGLSIYLNHGRERKVEDKVGWFQGCKVVGGQPRGDAHFLLSHRATGPVLEAAERNPSMFGFSHVVDANTRRVGGRNKVESIVTPASVDLVVDPATTKGFFESIERGGRTVANKVVATKVIEDQMAGAGPNLKSRLRRALVEQLDGRDHQAAVTQAFRVAGEAIWAAFLAAELDEETMLSRFRKLAKGHKDAGGSGDDSGAPSFESRQVPVGRAFAESIRHGVVTTEESHAAFVRSLRD